MLKRVVIKEEMVALTGNYIDAILLQQFVYWSERVRDFDKFIKQEIDRAEKYDPQYAPKIKATNGWIYKTSEELSNETMIGLSPSNTRKHIKSLVEKGWISERNNPKYKWDKTLQYRLDLIRLQSDLHKLGYSLEGYKVDVSAFSVLENGYSELEDQSPQNRKAIPETTTGITTDITLLGIASNDDDSREITLSFSEYESRYIIEEDKRKSINYYLKLYKRVMRKEHPRYSIRQWSNSIEDWFSLFDERISKSFDNDIYVMENIIDAHFKTRYNTGEHSITHFLSGKIKINRYYETRFDETREA
jgi:hypothetical protein